MTPTRHAPARLAPWPPSAEAVALALLVSLAAPAAARAAPPVPPDGGPAAVKVVTTPDGARLTVGGEDFLVKGMNWDYFPIGTNYNYDFWGQPDDVITAALANEMPLMQRMGVNALRLYTGIPPRWIRYIHEKYGIYTILNHTVGRYGYNLDGVWVGSVDYSSPRFRAAVKAELAALVEQFKVTPGLLMWMLGN